MSKTLPTTLAVINIEYLQAFQKIYSSDHILQKGRIYTIYCLKQLFLEEQMKIEERIYLAWT